MSSGPDISPLIEIILGKEYRVELQRRLYEAADRADDPSYARRLREAAEGSRPLRSLLADPSWLAASGIDRAEEAEDPLRDVEKTARARTGSPAEQRLGSDTSPPMKIVGLSSMFDDVVARAERTGATVSADRLTGWQGSFKYLAAQQPDGSSEPKAGYL